MKALRDALFHHAVRVIDLFREWDSDASGKVNKTEFAQALPSLGLTVTREQSDLLFGVFDPDGSGSIDYKEMNKALRSGSELHINPALYAGAAGAIVMEAKTKHALRKGIKREKTMHEFGDVLGGADKDGRTPQERLRDALSKNATRIVDLFRQWDADGDGQVSKSEFRKAIGVLGLNAAEHVVDELFDSFDPDHSGMITYQELNAMLRRGTEITLDASLRVGNSSKLFFRAKNPIGTPAPPHRPPRSPLPAT